MTTEGGGTPATGVIDLRSDTVTLPTAEMLERMHRAPLGDDSRDGDPTVKQLEARAAGLTGKEAAMFVPSGTMGNLVAMLAHAPRGGHVLADSEAHLLNSEIGSVVGIARLVPKVVPSKRGAMDVNALDEAIRTSRALGLPGPALIWMETTHNGAGGAVLPLAHMEQVHRLGLSNGLPVHVDGARLFNAAVALGVEAARIAQFADSIMFCVSKGLSAPIGSVLAGSQDFIARARPLRRLLGGNMRQAGIIAAAGLVALDSMVDRLADDHAAAQKLAQGLSWIDPALADPATVPTNILRIDLAVHALDAPAWASAMKQHGVLIQASGARQLRLVTHRHIDSTAIARTLEAFAAVASR